MKLKTKILLLVLLPILIIGAATYIVGSIRITSVTKDIVRNELEGIAELTRDDCSLPSGNAFFGKAYPNQAFCAQAKLLLCCVTAALSLHSMKTTFSTLLSQYDPL